MGDALVSLFDYGKQKFAAVYLGNFNLVLSTLHLMTAMLPSGHV